MRISDWSSDVCSSDLHVSLRCDYLCLVAERTGEAAYHFLRADLPEVPLAAVPIVEDRCRPFAIGEGCMFLNQSFEHPFPIGAAQTLPDDAFRICVTFEAAIDIQHESHAAGHASTEVASGAAKDDRRPAGHIFAAIRAAAFDNHLRDRTSTRLNSSHYCASLMPSSDC